MPDRKQITVRVDPERKQEWEEYQEELGYETMNRMIRNAVERLYQTRMSDEGEGLDVLLDRFDELEDKLDDFGSEVKRVRSEQLSQDNVAEFAQETAYFIDQSVGKKEGGEVIDSLQEDGVEYVQINLDDALSDAAHVPTEDPLIVDLEKARDNNALREIIAELDESDHILPIPTEEAAAYSL